jgi:hypothetical protein
MHRFLKSVPFDLGGFSEHGHFTPESLSNPPIPLSKGGVRALFPFSKGRRKKREHAFRKNLPLPAQVPTMKEIREM